jgi:membrane fusion protein (multidrug efflux system)
MKRHQYGAAALACTLLLAACQQGDGAKGNDDEEETPPIPVETSLPVRGDVFAVYSGTAPIEAFAQADVIAKVAGEIRHILVEEGDDVNQGDVLARLDGDRLRLELNESRARLRKLQRDFERNKDLKEKGLISEGDFENIQYELEALQASYNLANLELDYTQIRAPISGVVSERYVKLGNTIAVGEPVFRVTSFEPLVAYLHIPEREYRQIASGQPVRIDIDALAGAQIFEDVTRVSPVVDPDTGTFKITIEIDDAQRRIKPGMFGRMSIIYDRHENALQVPRSAIVEEIGTTSVFVVEDGVAIRRPVTTGFSANGFIEIIEGIDDDDYVITVGQVGLKPEAAVSVINATDHHPADDAATADSAEDSAVTDGDSSDGDSSDGDS